MKGQNSLNMNFLYSQLRLFLREIDVELFKLTYLIYGFFRYIRDIRNIVIINNLYLSPSLGTCMGIPRESTYVISQTNEIQLFLGFIFSGFIKKKFTIIELY